MGYNYTKKSYGFDVREKIRILKETIGCQICGIKEACCLDFHHLRDKEATIGQMVASRYGLKKILTEIAKCCLVCANCHRKIHYGVIDSPTINLWSIVGPEIQRLTNRMSVRPLKTLNCKHCKIEFKDREQKTYCSNECRGADCRKVIRPPKEILEQDISQMSWKAVGKKYGVTDNAVRKWAKKYGLLTG